MPLSDLSSSDASPSPPPSSVEREGSSAVREALAILNAIDDAVFIFDADQLAFRFVNQGAARQTGYGEDELLGMTPLDLKPLFDAETFRELLDPLLSGERSATRFETLHLPVADMTPPDVEQVERFVAFVDRVTARGQAVGVHCLAGLGRTGTMVACYLVSRGMSAEQAIERVRQRRPGSIQTELQELAVRRWERVRSGEWEIGRFL